MTLVAFECSSARRSVAVWRDGRILAEASEVGGRDTRLLGMVEESLGSAAVPRETVGTLAVGLGPGSYTGIRASIAVAEGWALAGGAVLVGVRSIDAVALRCQRMGWRGRYGLVVDGQRGEFYVGDFELREEGQVERAPLRLVSVGELRDYLLGGFRLSGPDVLATGLPGQPVHPDAAAIAELAGAMDGRGSSERLEPVYLRPVEFKKAKAA